jgi:hypothetical protein
MGDICGAWGFWAGDDVCMRWEPIWGGAKFWFCMVGDGVWVKGCCCGKPNWGCCDGVWERERAVPVESRFWGTDEDNGKGRAPFIWGVAIALGSMKLAGSYMAFWGDWKSMMRGYGERVRSTAATGGARQRDEGEGRRTKDVAEGTRESVQST